MTRQAYEAVVRPALPDFAAAHPDATVEVLIDYAYRDIVADRFDAGIRLGEKVERDMIVRRVGPDLSMAVVAAPSYLAQAEPVAVPGDLTRHRCINYRMTGAGTLYAWEFERGGQASHGPRLGTARLQRARADARCGAGRPRRGLPPRPRGGAARRGGRLVRLLADWTPPFPGFHVYYSSRRQMRPVLAAFLDALRTRR